MRKNLKIFCLLLIIVFSVVICNKVYATENTTKEVSLEIIDENGKQQTIMPPESGAINGYIDSSLDYLGCQYEIWLDVKKDCEYEKSFKIEGLGTFEMVENSTHTNTSDETHIIYRASITDQSILKTGKFSSKTFKVKNLTTRDYENFKIYLLCFKNQFENNANLSVKGVDFIKNGKIISEEEDFGSYDSTYIFAYYNRVYNYMYVSDELFNTLKYNNMGKNFYIRTDTYEISPYTGIRIAIKGIESQEGDLVAETITNGVIYDKVVNSIGSEYKNLQVYNISLPRIEPNGKIELSIPIQNNINTSNLVVYRIDDNGNKVQYDVTVKNDNGQDYAVFETEYSSVYVLAEKTELITSTDEKTNVQFSAPKDVVPENTVLDVKEVTDATSLNQIRVSLQDTSTKYVTYDITLKSNNVAIQPNGKVQISIPIPKNFDKNNLAVYRIEPNGDKIAYEITIKTIDGQDYAVFETDHFSNYVLAEKTLDETGSKEEQNKQHILDDEPKTGTTNNIGLIAVMVVITISIIFLYKKYK